jgi:hypothetical protein
MFPGEIKEMGLQVRGNEFTSEISVLENSERIVDSNVYLRNNSYL